ncbi:MAG: DUF2721 domain-containing protein [Microscillaceae bacterium]|nr:DUF2721 domain-containing protein [Microscillaceae bacterium]MDW8459708.1 DUF2721 domain-containing protein [Cytophagales bacterium]
MKIDISTPSLLFPAISLLMLAYTNRFLAIASLIRNLHAKYKETGDKLIRLQIKTLRTRLLHIRNMQAFGTLSLFLCVFCMFLVFEGYQTMAQYVFLCSVLSMLVSLAISMVEISLSVRTLDIQIQDIIQHPTRKKKSAETQKNDLDENPQPELAP